MAKKGEEENRYQRRSVSFDMGLYAEAMKLNYDEEKESNFEILNRKVSKKPSWEVVEKRKPPMVKALFNSFSHSNKQRYSFKNTKNIQIYVCLVLI